MVGDLQAPIQEPFNSKKVTQPSKGIQFIPLPLVGNYDIYFYTSIYPQFRDDVNQGINQFNDAVSPEAKIVALQKIQAAIRYVDLNALPENLAGATKFHQIKKDLFSQIKLAYAENGTNNLVQPGKTDTPIARIIAGMQVEKADRLMEILSKGKSISLNAELNYLYHPTDFSEEAKQWKQFLTKHTIDFLGGGNSKNFTVTSLIDGSVKVLKVDNRLNMPRHVEQHLREKLGDVFTSLDADRQTIGRDSNNTYRVISRTLLVTDLCSSGSVLEHSAKVYQTDSPSKLFTAASNVMEQMTQVFMDIQKAGCCFPDSKLTNWLIDSEDKIRLADTKSFLFTQDGIYNRYLDANKGAGIISTNGFQPRELYSREFNAEKLHASLLGKNIYAYLTGEFPHYVDMNHKIFSTVIDGKNIGAEYRALIMDLCKDPAALRMSLRDAQFKLLELGIISDPTNTIFLDKHRDLKQDILLKQNLLLVKAENLAKACVFDGFADLLNKELKASQSNPLTSQEMMIVKLDTLLDKIDKSIERFSQLASDLGKLDKDDTSFSQLNKEFESISNSADSLEDLDKKISALNTKIADKVHLKTTSMQVEIKQLSYKIADLGFGNDIILKNFLTSCEKDLKSFSGNNYEVLDTTLEKMKTVYNDLSSPECSAVRDTIEQFGRRNKWYTRNMEKKALSIEHAMASVPLEERGKLLKSDRPEVTAVLAAIASNRTNPFSLNKTPEQTIENSSSTQFKIFKTKFKEQMAQRKEEGLDKEKVNKFKNDDPEPIAVPDETNSKPPTLR